MYILCVVTGTEISHYEPRAAGCKDAEILKMLQKKSKEMPVLNDACFFHCHNKTENVTCNVTLRCIRATTAVVELLHIVSVCL